MLTDIRIVMWKEWKDRDTRWWTSLLGLIIAVSFFGVMLAVLSTSDPPRACRKLQTISAQMVSQRLETAAQLYNDCPQYHWVTAPLMPIYWVLLPYLLLQTPILLDTFAGERERHTLNTLFASRLPDRALLIGKIAGQVLYGWVLAQLIMVVALITAFIKSEHFLFYSLPSLLICPLFGLLFAAPMATIPTLFSAHAVSTKQARQRYGCFIIVVYNGIPGLLLLLFIKIEDLGKIIFQWLVNIISNGVDPVLVVVIVAVLLLVLNVGIMTLAIRRFKRGRLMLD